MNIGFVGKFLVSLVAGNVVVERVLNEVVNLANDTDNKYLKIGIIITGSMVAVYTGYTTFALANNAIEVIQEEVGKIY